MRIPTEELVKQYQDRLFAAALSIHLKLGEYRDM